MPGPLSAIAISMFLTAREGEQVPGQPAGVLYDIVVDQAHRGRGIGQALLDATLAELKTRGAPQVVLSTAERNESAQRLFARAGFRRTMIEMTRELESGAGAGQLD